MILEAKKIKSKFVIGSEWLSYKIYMGTQTADDFIKHKLPKVIEGLKREGSISSWFFVRYADPELHLRLRFKLIAPQKITEVVSRIYDSTKSLVDNRSIHNIQIDTYKRELDRYGYNTIEQSENLFCTSSNMIMHILKMIDKDENMRWLWGMKTIDIVLNQFELSLKQKENLLFELKDDFGKEFGINKPIRKQLSMKFRNHRKHISEIIKAPLSIEIHEFFTDYKKQYSKIYNAIKSSDGYTQKKSEYLLYSYIHMHCNRLFSSKQRMNEWALYDLLYQYYYSEYARIHLAKKHINSTYISRIM